MNKLLLGLLLSLLISHMGYAQTRQVTGRVTSADDNAGLPGVSVSVKGRTAGTLTDATGNYSLGVNDGTTLVFSFIGFATIEEVVGNRSTINLTLQPDTRNLSEVVVTGYGQQIKRDLTGNIAKIKQSDIQDIPSPPSIRPFRVKPPGCRLTRAVASWGRAFRYGCGDSRRYRRQTSRCT